MKTKQTKIDRSAAKWLPGAMALAATTASSQAATVQITLTGNKISSSGNQLVADLTGDTLPDVGLTGGAVFAHLARVYVGGGMIQAFWTSTWRSSVERWVNVFGVDANIGGGGVGTAIADGGSPRSISYMNPIIFTDARINGGVATSGWLQVNAFNTSATSHTVELSRLIFDDASTTRPGYTSIPGVQTEWVAVPEPSSLGLLALGAGGLLARRRRAA